MQKLVIFLMLTFCASTSTFAQTVDSEVKKQLRANGFKIESTGYTWLGRITVRASDGRHERELVINRGSGQIIQDNWKKVGDPGGGVPLFAFQRREYLEKIEERRKEKRHAQQEAAKNGEKHISDKNEDVSFDGPDNFDETEDFDEPADGDVAEGDVLPAEGDILDE